MWGSKESGTSADHAERSPNLHLEYGRTAQVMEGFFRKQSLLSAAQSLPPEKAAPLLEQAQKIWCGVFFSGGGLGVSTQIGFAEQLYDLGFPQGVINAYVGASGGSIVASHSVIGDFDSVNILPETCDAGFIERSKTKPWQILNYFPLDAILRKYALNRVRLQRAQPDVYAITVETSSGENKGKWHAFDLKHHEDPEAILAASSLIPVISRQEFAEIDGVHHNDGGLIGYPVEFMDSLIPEGVEEVNWLVIDAMPIETTPRDYAIANALDAVGRRLRDPAQQIGLSFLKACHEARSALFMRHWRTYQTGRVENYGIVAPQRLDVGTYTNKKQKVLTAIEDSRLAAKQFFAKHTPAALIGVVHFPQSA